MPTVRKKLNSGRFCEVVGIVIFKVNLSFYRRAVGSETEVETELGAELFENQADVVRHGFANYEFVPLL